LLFFLLEGLLDDTDGDGLFHVSDCESSEWWEFIESLDNHCLGWDHSNNAGITCLEVFWEFFSNLTSSLVHFVFDFSEFACNMACVAIEHWSVTIADLTWMVHDDNLGLEVFSILSWDVFVIGSDVTSLDIGN